MINSIVGIHTVELYNPSIHNCDGVLDDSMVSNYYFIKLPYKSNTTLTIPNIFQFEFLNIGGIPIPYLNANYPINYTSYQSSHEIIACEPNAIYFNSTYKATFSTRGGGNKIIIGKIINTIEGFPYADNYTYKAKTIFNNVVRIELVSTEIPYVNFNINRFNNRLYWKLLEDGDYIYSVVIPEGNYNMMSLPITLMNLMNGMVCINSASFMYFDIIININSHEVQIIAFTYTDISNKIPTCASFIFTSDDTLGSILGFKYTGMPNCITTFQHVTSNTSYYNMCPYDEVGNSMVFPNILNFNSNYNYMFLYINDYENINTNPNIMNAFAKILIRDDNLINGNIMFNTFVKHSPLVFEKPISSISEFKISFLLPDGSRPDFRNIDHSFTLKITEVITQCSNSGLNSKNSNYIETLENRTIML